MTKKERALLAVEALKKEYPGAVCSLEYQDPLQLLIATRLSAQCTDARVNLVTPALFARFPTLEAFCAGSEEEIAELIRSCGLYKTKARDIFAMCHVLRDSYNGVIPDTVDELTKLPGVGKKTAERLLVELKDKVGDFAGGDIDEPESLVAGKPDESGIAADAAKYLRVLGYEDTEIQPVLKKLSIEYKDVSPLVSAALREFGKQ